MLYSFSFCQNPNWTAPYPSGKEIVRYLYDVCARFKILDKIQCDVNVKSLVWKDEDKEWVSIFSPCNFDRLERHTFTAKKKD